LNIRISPDLQKKAAQSAFVKGITLNQMIRQALEKELEKNP
jgi:predicted HicB family RNase H-like nuclease